MFFVCFHAEITGMVLASGIFLYSLLDCLTLALKSSFVWEALERSLSQCCRTVCIVQEVIAKS